MIKSFNSFFDKTYIVLFVTIISHFMFFRFVALGNTLTKLPAFVLTSCYIIFFYKKIFWLDKNIQIRCLNLLLFSYFVSYVMALLFHDQDLLSSYSATIPMLSFLFFFFLQKLKPDVLKLENIVFFFSVLYCVFWIVAYVRFPSITFGYDNNEGMVSEDLGRGFQRISIPGLNVVILNIFILLCRFVNTNCKKYLFFTLFFFIFVLLSLTRQTILLTLLFSIYYLFQRKKKYFFYIFIFLSVVFFLNSEDSIVSKMLELTTKQIDDNNLGEKNIRIIEYETFFSDFHANFLTHILGNGVPGNSAYGDYYVSHYCDQRGIYLSDVGYGMMYATNGLVGLLIYVFLFISVLRKKVAARYYYAKLYVLYQIPGNLMASIHSTPFNMICVAICIFVIVNISKNESILLSSKTK